MHIYLYVHIFHMYTCVHKPLNIFCVYIHALSGIYIYKLYMRIVFCGPACGRGPGPTFESLGPRPARARKILKKLRALGPAPPHL